MIWTSVEKESFHNNVNSAMIVVRPKPNKDHTLTGNCRPLSLLCSEVKLYAKVLLACLESNMTTLVHHDQTGFINPYMWCSWFCYSPNVCGSDGPTTLLGC